MTCHLIPPFYFSYEVREGGIINSMATVVLVPTLILVIFWHVHDGPADI